jgi:tetratricopeptide (TPR) repeat protein
MYFSRILTIVFVVTSSVAQLAAQGRGTTTTGGTSTGPTAPTTGTMNTPSSTTNTSPSNRTPFPGDSQPGRGIVISGKVAATDGTPIQGGVLIERICSGGRPHPEGYTDPKGRFMFTIGQEIGVFSDASEATSGRSPSGGGGRGITDRQLMGCELRAVLPGFRSETVSLATHQYMDNPDIGTILVHRAANVEGLTISATSAMAPKDARKAFEKGLEAEKKDKPDEAQKDLEKAVELYPKYATAWFELGMTYERREHIDKAREAYQQAIAADSKYINPYERMYMLAFKDAKWQEVADTTDHVIHLNPYDFPGAFYYNAVANFQLHQLDPAEKSAREAVKLDTRHLNPRTNYVLGLILAQKGNLSESAEFLRAYLKDAPQAPDADRVKQQISEIEQMAAAKPQPKN